MKYVLLILLVSSISMAQLSTSQRVDIWEAAVKPYVEICKTESGVNPSYPERMKLLEYPDEEEFRCYMKCLYQKLDIIDDVGQVNVFKLATQLTQDDYDHAVGCKMVVRGEPDLCKLAYKMLLCTVNLVPQ